MQSIESGQKSLGRFSPYAFSNSPTLPNQPDDHIKDDIENESNSLSQSQPLNKNTKMSLINLIHNEKQLDSTSATNYAKYLKLEWEADDKILKIYLNNSVGISLSWLILRRTYRELFGLSKSVECLTKEATNIIKAAIELDFSRNLAYKLGRGFLADKNIEVKKAWHIVSDIHKELNKDQEHTDTKLRTKNELSQFPIEEIKFIIKSLKTFEIQDERVYRITKSFLRERDFPFRMSRNIVDLAKKQIDQLN